MNRIHAAAPVCAVGSGGRVSGDALQSDLGERCINHSGRRLAYAVFGGVGIPPVDGGLGTLDNLCGVAFFDVRFLAQSHQVRAAYVFAVAEDRA